MVAFVPGKECHLVKKRALIVLSFLCLVFLWIPEQSFADGAIIPTYVGKLPEMPIQRAIIKHRDGLETLIIEATFDGRGDRFGWIIPVPAIPSRFEELDPDFMRILSIQTQPKVFHFDQFTVGLIICSVIFISICCLAIAFKARRFLIIFLIASGIMLILILILIPHFIFYRGSGGIERVGVKVISTQLIGNYQIDVLKAGNSSKLNEWLASNGYARVNEKALGIVEEYIDKKWCFVAAKLLRPKNGRTTTHPILIEFMSDKPVYPMRLTSLSGSEVKLELFIIAEKEAFPVNYSLIKEYCNIFHAGNRRMITSTSARDSAKERIVFIEGPPLEGGDKDRGSWMYEGRLASVHPDAVKVMWDGCVVTRLTGNISSVLMKKDLLLRFKEVHPPYKPFRKEIWSYQTALLTAGIIAYISELVIFIIKFSGISKNKFFKKYSSALLVFIPALFFLTIYIGLGEKVETEKKYCSNSRTKADIKNAFTAAQAYFVDHPDGFPILEKLKDYGWQPSSCAYFVVEGKGLRDFKITAFPLFNIQRTYMVDSDGRIHHEIWD